MSALKFGAIIVGICALLLLAVSSSEKASRKRKERGDEYDERQKLARSEAYRRALIAVFVFLAADTFISGHFTWAAEPTVRLWMAAAVGIAAFELAAIRRDAYFKLGASPKAALVCSLAVAVFLAVSAVFYLYRGTAVRNGMLTKSGVICVFALFRIIITAAMADRQLRLRREELEGD